MDIVVLNEDIKRLANEVYEKRKSHIQCRSAKNGVDMNILLQEIVDKKIYEKDYDEITSKMLLKIYLIIQRFVHCKKLLIISCFKKRLIN